MVLGVLAAVPMSRRAVGVGVAALAGCGLPPAHASLGDPSVGGPVRWGPFVGMSSAEMEALDETSKDPFAGEVRPSGVRVIDLVIGRGPEPKRGAHVYANFKVWSSGFRVGTVADYR